MHATIQKGGNGQGSHLAKTLIEEAGLHFLFPFRALIGNILCFHSVEHHQKAPGVHKKAFPTSDIMIKQVALVSAMGSTMDIPGMLRESIRSLSQAVFDLQAIDKSDYHPFFRHI